ncbi:MAG: AsmA family protein [Kiloniellaceae bacterium]
MKRLGLILLGLVVLLLAAILIGPGLVDWNAHKDRIAAEARKLTGRELTIDGDINLALLPAPALSADKVRLANIEGGSAPVMAELESLEVRIALMPLLRGRVQVETVSLVKPLILLEVLPDGRKNWDLVTAKPDAPAASGGATEPGLAGQVRLDSVTISDGTVVYRDAAAGREERIEKLNAEIAAGSLEGPFAAAGDAVVRGLETEFRVDLGRLLDAGATSLNLALGLPRAGANAQFGGALSLHPDGASLRGRVKVAGDSLAALIGELSGETDVPAILAKPFGLVTELSADRAQVSAAELALRLGEMSIDGDLQVTLGPPLDARINLAASQLDLDKLLAEAGAGAAPRAGGKPPGKAATVEGPPAGGFALPAEVTGSLEVAVDALVYRGQVVRQVLLTLGLAEGQVKVSQALALLPGGSDVSLTGTIAVAEQGTESVPRFTGRIEAASDNLRGVFDWLGVDVAAVPAERLRRMSLTSRIDAAPGQLTLGDIDLRVDLSRATGGIAMALRERPGFGVGLAIDRLSLDAYLPAIVAGGRETSQGQADANRGSAGEPGGQDVAGGLRALESFDANLDLKIGQITLRGITARDLRLDATLQHGAITLREVRVGDLAGSSAGLSGTLTDLAGRPVVEGSVDLMVADPVRLAKLANLESDVLSRIGAVDLTGSVKGSAEQVAFDAKAAALGGHFNLTGTIRPVAQPLAFDMTLKAEHPDVARLLRTLAAGLARGPDLGGLDLRARIKGTPQRIRVTGLAGNLGPVELSGSLGAALSGPKPAIELDLSTGAFPVGALLAPAAAGKGSADTSGAGGKPDPSAARGERWSPKPIDLSVLNAVNAEVKLKFRALLFGKLRLDDAAIDATLTDGVVELRKLSGTLYDGALSVVGKVEVRDGLEAGLAVTAIEVRLGQLLRAAAETDRVSGPLNLSASLTTRGTSAADLISALSGKGDLSGTLDVRARKEEQAAAALLDILGRKIREIRGVTDTTNALFNAFAGAPAALTGTFTVERGVVETTDMRIDGRQAVALTRGTADLPAWVLETRTDVYREPDPDTSYLWVELHGPLDDPNPRIGGRPFQRRPQPADSGGRAGPQPSGQQPWQAPREATPEDILKEGLKGLLKGFGN